MAVFNELVIPETFTTEFLLLLEKRLRQLASGYRAEVAKALPAKALRELVERARVLLEEEPTLVVVEPHEGATVTVVGDLHGQLADLLQIFQLVGHPSEDNYFVFNGDFVDRGAHGLELLVLLLGWKLAEPRRVFLLRGNHESVRCKGEDQDGLDWELIKKLRRVPGKELFAQLSGPCGLFQALPLAAVVAGATLVLHGGLFRAPPAGSRRQLAGAGCLPDRLGSLLDLRHASKGGPDPDLGSTRLAADVLWSDPRVEPGWSPNDERDIGITFGPDITEAFLEEAGLRLVLRSHEGPDARELRPEMPQLLDGWSLDHVTPRGKLFTVFSAPDAEHKGAVAVLSPPSYATPCMLTFEAAQLPVSGECAGQ